MSVTLTKPTVQAPQEITTTSPAAKKSTSYGLVVGVVVLALVTVGVLIMWLLPFNSPTSSTAVPVDMSYYGIGTSTYNQQVPEAARSWTLGYGPGSATYAEQVPVGPADASSWITGYIKGSNTYRQQVP